MKSVTTAVVLQYNLPCYDCIFCVLYNGYHPGNETNSNTLFFYPLCSVCGPKACLLSGIQVLHEIRWGFVSGFSVILINIASEYLNNLAELILTMYPQMSGMILIPHLLKL